MTSPSKEGLLAAAGAVEASHGAGGPDPKQTALAAIEGLTFADCFKFFDQRATDRDRQIAEMAETKDGEVEVDGAITSEGDDNGSYVLAWLWIDFEGTDLDKKLDEESAA